jgi:3-oxoacyl-[acyl-carrier protein] reductase
MNLKIKCSARGLGKAIAERFASLGADIVINYSKDSSSANEVVAKIEALGVRVIAIQADISKTADIERVIQRSKKSLWEN